MTIVGAKATPKNVYYAGFSGSVVVPADVTVLLIVAQAAGGSGDEGTFSGPAGGGGGFGIKEVPVLDTEWGTSLTVAVGDGAAGANGGDTTITGTLNGTALSCSALGGTRGALLADGAGGTASGFDTNIDGYPGAGFVAVPADEAVSGLGGKGGGFDQDLCEDPTAGAGGDGSITGAGDIAGYPGYLVLIWG